jgi:Ca-activated chloride channel homolog
MVDVRQGGTAQALTCAGDIGGGNVEEGVMIFDRAWVLVFLVLAPLLVWSQWRMAVGKLNLVLKALMIAAVILALSEPRLQVSETKVATAVLVDTSASISADDLKKASDLVAQLDSRRGRHWMRVIPFARKPRELSDAERIKGWSLKPAGGDDYRGTDLEAAVRDATASLPAGMVPRVLLISDGQETEGSVARGAWMARQLGVPVDTYPLPGRPAPLLRIESTTIPSIAFSGEKFPVTFTVSSPKKTSAVVELSAEGKVLGTRPVSLEPGSNQIKVHTSLNVSGAVEISGVVKSDGYGDVHFKQAVTLRRPRVRFVSQDPAGTESHLMDALRAAQIDVDRASDINADLSNYQIIVLNNQDLEAMPLPRKEAIEQYVKDGGGLLVIGGERNVYVENKKVEDALERALPAKLAPPRSPEGTCVVLIVDKSSSMEGRKMDLARLSAIGAIDHLRPVDYVGVLIFDNSFQWAVPIRRAEDRSTIKRIVSGITPDGGTQIAPALAEAYRQIQKSKATYRHIVLLTDGISEEGDSIPLSKEAAASRITISTVGLGQDVNRAYLEKIAVNAKGRPYFLTDPSGLEQILIKDVMEHTGSTAIEKPIVPVVVKKAAVLDGVPVESAPPLRGYVKFIAKPSADTILSVDKKDPLYASWQFGLGRSAVFASDAKSRWAERWVSWEGFDRLWVNIFRDLLPHTQAGEATLAFDNASQSIVVDYKLAAHVKPPVKVPDIFVLGPDGFRKAVPIQKMAEGSWRGTVAIGSRQGLFRVRPLEDTRLFPETGLYRDEQELRLFGSNEPLLRRVSQYTGGRFAPKPDQVFDAGGRSIAATMSLWPGLLGAAVVLNLIELILRKWRGIVDTLRRSRLFRSQAVTR